MTKITAGRGTLDARDFIRSLIYAGLTPVGTILIDSISAGNFDLNWNHIWKVAVAAMVTYLIKNLLEPAKVIVTDPVKVEAAKQGETITVTPKTK